ncbi:MAG TPA: tRNA uridine-5-carboxymethylaminomethyl(34) synthesis GTPase MnmE [Salinivirgaceae bacterium]|nr:tRNA uridine-5-carboxymethylaminomethyl(34) synthesis GTPase MnmE [Salinivirgaceae bacterium]HQA75484.1 tRNA uridine-5-carboxymethylaminomethyl(34) synthesis GTPase MnmE [Salinivirgaceae bacterium]
MNFDFDDLICSISTPQGVGAIAIVRISGKGAKRALENLFFPATKIDISSIEPRKAYYGQIISHGNIVDEVVVTWFKAPESYTGDDVIEIGCHGSQYIQRQLMQLLIENGCRTAKPGEFTMRAFLNGKMDLTQAEAINDLIHARNGMSHKMAMSQVKGSFSKRLMQLSDKLLNLISLVELELDFSEEDVEFADRNTLRSLINEVQDEVKKLYDSYASGQAIKEGIPVAIVGQPNAGKSTLLNKILQEDRAIVSDIPGTTRDTIEDTITLSSIEFRFIDTAGLRRSIDNIEKLGIERSIDKIANAWIVIFLFDATGEVEDIKHACDLVMANIDNDSQIIFIANKIDLLPENEHYSKIEQISNSINVQPHDILLISAKKEQNLDYLIKQLTLTAQKMLPSEDSIIIHNTRQYELLMKILVAISNSIEAIEKNLTGDLLAFELRKVLSLVGELTGTTITPDMILGNIFEHFCIGK